MEILLIMVLVILVAGFAGIFIYLKRQINKTEENPLINSIQTLQTIFQNQLNEITRRLDESGVKTLDTIQKQFSESRLIVSDVSEKLKGLEKTNERVVDFADQLKNFQEMLKNPIQRGVVGQFLLGRLLGNVMSPEEYREQYVIGKDDEGKELKPDAVICIKDNKIIPVDAKFSLPNYNKFVEEKNPIEKARLEKVFVNDLKLRIQETSKYIRPSMGTTDFAFMFIPHEAIYYDLLTNRIGGVEGETETLVERAASKYKVIIVSPTSFWAYLQTVVYGLKALHIEESAKEIRKGVDNLGKHLASYSVYMKKIGDNFSTTVNMYNKANQEFAKIDKDILKTTGNSIDAKSELISLPEEWENNE